MFGFYNNNKVLQSISKLNIVPHIVINPYLPRGEKLFVPRVIGEVSKPIVQTPLLPAKVIQNFNNRVDSDVFVQGSTEVAQEVAKKAPKAHKNPNRHVDKQALAEYFDNYHAQDEALDVANDIATQRLVWFEKEVAPDMQKPAQQTNGWSEDYIKYYYRYRPAKGELTEAQQDFLEYADSLAKNNIRVNNLKSKFVKKAMLDMFDEKLPQEAKQARGVENFGQYVESILKFDSSITPFSLISKIEREAGENFMSHCSGTEFLDNLTFMELLIKDFKNKNPL